MSGIICMRGIRLNYLHFLFIFILLIPLHINADGFDDKSPIKLVYPEVPKAENKPKTNYVIYNNHFVQKPVKTVFPKLIVIKPSKKMGSIFTNTLTYKHSSLFKADVIHPVSGNVIKNFGWTAFGEGGFNTGIIIKPTNVQVDSPSSGKIIFIGDVQNYGKTFAIKSNQFFTVISGIIQSELKEGSTVQKGQKIGQISSDIHFEVRDFRGNPYDPIAVVNKKKRIIKNANIFQAFEKLLLKHGFHSRYIPTMFCIANWESSLNPSATNYNTNRTVDIGLFQINSIWKKKCNTNLNQLYDIDNNTKCALVVLKNQGLTAWVTYKKYSSLCSG